jgi:hypothetical protein
MQKIIRAVTVACAIAAGSFLAPSSASAQSPGWNVIRPIYCFESVAVNTSGQYVYTTYVYTDTFTVTVVDPVMSSTALQYCYSASAFWGYFAGPSVWSMFWITPGMK